jgi:hypothetical protein
MSEHKHAPFSFFLELTKDGVALLKMPLLHSSTGDQAQAPNEALPN